MTAEKNSNSWIGKLFMLWLITMVFGAKLLPISLPGFTIYLNLLLGVALFFILLVNVKLKESIKHLKFGSPVFLLLLLGGLALVIGEGKAEALFTFRALLVFALTASNLLLAYAYLGKTNMYTKLQLSLWYYLGICLVFGFFEFFTGIHFAGNHTDKLLEMPVSLITYAPTFLWDNPNTYIAYISITSVSLLVLDRSIQANLWKQLVICIPIFFFAIVGQSLFGLCIGGILGIVFIAAQFQVIVKNLKSSIFLLIASIGLLLITFLMNDVFLGPKWKDGEKYRLNSLTAVQIDGNDIKVIPTDTLLNQVSEDTIIKRLHDQVYSSMGSFELRKNLILNGIDYWKQKPITGIGAGQYSYYNAQGKNQYPVEKLLNPHNFAIELLAQFGIFGIIFLGSMLYAFVRLLKYARSRKRVAIITGGALVFLLASCLPSSLLIYDCLWLFIGVLFIEAFLVKDDPVLNENK